jgi:hypothetical protein
MEFVSHGYYNDVGTFGAEQDSITVFQFKSGSSSGAFKGNGQAYRLGCANNPSAIRVVQDTNDRYHIYARYGRFSDGSLVSVSYPRLFYFEIDESITTNMNFDTAIYIEIPIIKIYTSDIGIASSGVANFSSAISANTALAGENFHLP